MLNLLAPELAPIVHTIFTQSLEIGQLPREWSLANVAPIFKKGNRGLAEIYRSVSLTYITCKLFKHIVCKHILDHVEDQQILTNLQHGFRSGRSCEKQLITTTDDLLSSLTLTRHVWCFSGVEGKRRLCDLNVMSLSPALATRHIRCVLLINSPNKLNLLSWLLIYLCNKSYTMA